LLGICETKISFSESDTDKRRYIPVSTAKAWEQVPTRQEIMHIQAKIFIL
jgi:hypothetical protein